MTLNDDVNDTGSVVVVAIRGCVVDVRGTERKLRGWSMRLSHDDWVVGIVGEERFLP